MSNASKQQQGSAPIHQHHAFTDAQCGAAVTVLLASGKVTEAQVRHAYEFQVEAMEQRLAYLTGNGNTLKFERKRATTAPKVRASGNHGPKAANAALGKSRALQGQYIAAFRHARPRIRQHMRKLAKTEGRAAAIKFAKEATK
jgi:hypothetical protein